MRTSMQNWLKCTSQVAAHKQSEYLGKFLVGMINIVRTQNIQKKQEFLTFWYAQEHVRIRG